MVKSTRIVASLLIVFSLSSGYAVNLEAAAQSERTLAGEWIVTSTPINGQLTSPRGNSLGFPERDMFFEQEGELRTGTVLREDAGPDVRQIGRASCRERVWIPV